MITIRELTKDELKQAIELKILCWPEELVGKADKTLDLSEELKFWTKWRDTAKNYDDVRLLIGAFENEKMLGVAFASFAEVEDVAGNKGVELNGLWVYKEHRGRGISLRLISYVLDFFKNINKEKIVIYSFHYAPSNMFYRKFGAIVMKKVKQLERMVVTDVFVAHIDAFKDNIERSLVKYL